MRYHARKIVAVAALVVIAATFMLAAALFASGCGGDDPGPVAQKFIQTMSDRQFGDAYDMLASRSPARTVSREDFISMSEVNFPAEVTFTDVKVTETQIEGDKATVKWTAVTKQTGAADEPTEQQLSLVQEEGSWKVSE